MISDERREYKRAWRKANPERVAAHGKAWRRANPERVVAITKAWNEAHPGHAKAWSDANPGRKAASNAAWQKANPERVAAYDKAWNKANPDSGRERRAIRRARINSAFVESVDLNAVFIRDGGVCQICDTFIGDAEWHGDHRIPLSKGGAHSYANVQLAHAFCNLSKGAKVPA